MSGSAPAEERYEQRRFALPPEATEVVLVRHGASAAAVAGQSFPIVLGRGDPPLSDVGAEQARLVGERLASSGEEVRRLFVTPLRRTAETAAPFAAASGLEPAVVEDLIEVSLGEWEGGEYRIRARQGDPLVWQVLREERWDLIPGAESSEELLSRVRRGIERVVSETGPGGVAVAVVHGGVIGAACHVATASRPFAFIHADNGSISRLVVFPDGHWMLRSFNDTAHLDGLARQPAS